MEVEKGNKRIKSIIQKADILNGKPTDEIVINQEYNNGVITEHLKIRNMNIPNSAKATYSDESTETIVDDFTTVLDNHIPNPLPNQLNLSTTIAYEISGVVVMLNPFKRTGTNAVTNTLKQIDDELKGINAPDTIIHVETIIVYE